MKISWAATILALSLVGPMAPTTTTTFHALAYETLPPLPPLLLDLVIAMDESKSMKFEKIIFQENVGFIFDRLTASVPDLFRVGLVGFGSSVNGGAPRMLQALTKDRMNFSIAWGNLKQDGISEPGYKAVQQIANNSLVGITNAGRQIRTPLNDNKNPGAFPGEAGFCVILISDRQDEGNETLDDTAALLNKTKGTFFAITTDEINPFSESYMKLADQTGGKFYTFVDFNIRPILTLTDVLSSCLKIVNKTLALSTDICDLPDDYDFESDIQYCTDILDFSEETECQCAKDVEGNHVCISTKYRRYCDESCETNKDCNFGDSVGVVCVPSSTFWIDTDDQPCPTPPGNFCALLCYY